MKTWYMSCIITPWRPYIVSVPLVHCGVAEHGSTISFYFNHGPLAWNILDTQTSCNANHTFSVLQFTMTRFLRAVSVTSPLHSCNKKVNILKRCNVINDKLLDNYFVVLKHHSVGSSWCFLRSTRSHVQPHCIRIPKIFSFPTLKHMFLLY